MSLPQKQLYTAEDYWNLPEGERAELIGGQLYAMAPPNRIHQKLIAQFTKTFGMYIDAQRGNCEVYPALFAVNLDANDKNWVEPDLIVEIVSSSSRRQDYNLKNGLYATAGVREYWIVDPAKERTTVYHFDNDAAPTIFLFDQDIPVGIFPELKINIAALL